jgi:hypothetical protein
MNWTEPEQVTFRNGQVYTYYMPPDTPAEREGKPFFFKQLPDFSRNRTLETLAVCSTGAIPHDPLGNVEVRIKGLKYALTLQTRDRDAATRSLVNQMDDVLGATDVGGRLCPSSLDIFVGEETSSGVNPARQLYLAVMRLPDFQVEWRTKR